MTTKTSILDQPQPNRSRLYALTMWIELASALLRFVLVSALALFVLFPIAVAVLIVQINLQNRLDGLLLAWVGISLLIGLIAGFGMILVSLQAYQGYNSGQWFTRFLLGARPMSSREQEYYSEALSTIASSDIDLNKKVYFGAVYIVDSPLSSVYLIGTTLYMTSTALQDKHLAVMVAHELGALQRNVGGTVLALRSLVFPVFYFFVRNLRTWSTGTRAGVKANEEISPTDLFYTVANAVLFFFLALFGGGLGVWVTAPLWARYFQQEVFLSDAFVLFECDLVEELVEYLEQNRFYDTAVPYMLGWLPANELRLDRLNACLQEDETNPSNLSFEDFDSILTAWRTQIGTGQQRAPLYTAARADSPRFDPAQLQTLQQMSEQLPTVLDTYFSETLRFVEDHRAITKDLELSDRGVYAGVIIETIVLLILAQRPPRLFCPGITTKDTNIPSNRNQLPVALNQALSDAYRYADTIHPATAAGQRPSARAVLALAQHLVAVQTLADALPAAQQTPVLRRDTATVTQNLLIELFSADVRVADSSVFPTPGIYA